MQKGKIALNIFYTRRIFSLLATPTKLFIKELSMTTFLFFSNGAGFMGAKDKLNFQIIDAVKN